MQEQNFLLQERQKMKETPKIIKKKD